MNVETLKQAVTDALASVALVQARTADKATVHRLYARYSEALASDPGHEHGAALVAEMARVVGQAKD